MTDKDFLHAFETANLNEDNFDHAAHVRAGFLLIRRHGFVRALVRYCDALHALTEHFGVPEKYHETITIAFLALINERIAQNPDVLWHEFQMANPSVFSKTALLAFYTPEQLANPEYRKVFHLPRAGQTP